jgi:CubicO group peptidase (beta-lactamase class C family)
MHSWLRIFAIAILAAVTTAGAFAQDVAAKADQYLTAWADQGRFSGAILIAKGDKVLLRKAYGMANFELNVPNTPETVFRIGSTTKMFTAYSVLQLEEKGLLSVNDPVAKYVPEVPAAWSAITIHQLLCHKSGIPDFINSKAYDDFANPNHIENAIREYADKPLMNEPGATLRYSNAGYVLLGRVIEKVSGKSYEEYITENILKPAGMTHTAIDHAGDLVPHRASGYSWDGESVINAAREDPERPWAAGALRSTLDDMYRFDRAIKAGTLFSKALVDKASTPFGHWSAPPPFPLEADYGYGTMMGTDFGHRYMGHGGWVNGFVSQFTRYPDDDMVMIVMWNFETASQILVSRDLEAILFGAPYEVPQVKPIVHPAASLLARYAGDYQLGPMTLQITMRNGRLYIFSPGQPIPYGLVAISDTEFYCNNSPAGVRFVPDGNGSIAQMVVNLMGREMTAVRVAQKAAN